MALILGSLTLGDFPTTDQSLSNFTYFKDSGYVAPVSGTATAISMAVFSWGDVEGSQVRVGLYDSGKNLLAYATISGTAGGFISGNLNTSVSITSGNTYYIAVMVTFGTMYHYQSGSYLTRVQSASGYPTLPATLGAGIEVSTGSIGLALTGTIATPQTVTSINGSDPVSGDSSGNTFATTGFTESITNVDIDGLACTSVTETSGSGTFAVPAPISGEVYPLLGVAHDVTISGSTQSASLSKNFTLGTYTITTLSSPEIVDTTYPTALFDTTPVTGDKMITESGITVVGTNGGVRLDNPAVKIIMHQIASTGVIDIYRFTINEFGVTGGLVARGLTATGLTAVAPTARGL